MNRTAMKLLIQRIRIIQYQIENEKQRIEHIAESCKNERILKRLEYKQSRLLKKFQFLKSYQPLFLKRLVIYFECLLWEISEKIRLYKLKKAITKSDIKHVNDLLEGANEKPQDYQVSVNIQTIENKKSQFIGDRTLEVENLSTSVIKTYSLGHEASNDWFFELSKDIQNGYFKKS